MKIQVKKCIISESNHKQDHMIGNSRHVKNFNGNMNINIQNYLVYNKNFYNNYEQISIIEQNNKVINKYLNSLTGENIIKRRIQRLYVDFDATITFEVDNYLNLLHKPTGLYLMFNKNPFLECFYFKRI